jgi:hypothetical protein
MTGKKSPGDAVDELLAELAASAPLDPPPHVVRGWHAALAALPPPVAGPSPRPARRRRPRPARRGRPGYAAAAVCAAAAAGLFMVLPPASPVSPGAVLGNPALDNPALDNPALDNPALNNVDPKRVGDLADPARRAGCLARVGLPGATVLATRGVSWQGRYAVRLLLATPTPARFRSVTVTPDCGPGSGSLLADR